MKVNTATCLFLCGIALLVLSDRATPRLETLARAAAVLALLIGLATLTEYLFEWQLRIDELLAKDLSGDYHAYRGKCAGAGG